MTVNVKPASACRFDLVSLGEVMLRLDPGDTRIHTARSFRVWEGGGEYNVARGLKRCFGLRTAVVTAFVDNPVGRLLQDLVFQGGVDQSYVRFVPDDGVGRTVRNGLNFTERGFGTRAAVGCSDRGHTAASQMKPGEVDWDALFGKEGVRWLHTGGIFAALSDTTPAVAKEAMAAAKKHGTFVSYDLNYRASLWRSIGGKKRAQEVNRDLASHVDMILGNEEDFTAALGFEVEGLDENLSALDPANFRKMIEKAVAAFPNFQAVATTLRSVRSASVNDWAAVLYTGGHLYQSRAYDALEIWDRVGGGDSFASGLIYGFLADKDPQWAVECGAAHGALAMTTPGDTTMALLPEVERVMRGGSARVQR
jgi:2-dehydro-3-deoxygluconokinase